MIAKRHELDHRIILAVCDKEHVGKTFEDGQICFTASVKFYQGEEVSEKELEEMFKEADSINLFGNKCVDIAIKKGFASEKSVKLICGIKHTQAYTI
jgi:hypothetical protein